MSLYLAIFDEEENELAGWTFGHYQDVEVFRSTVASHLERERFPILMEHSDRDGEWGVAELPGLVDELREISRIFRSLPPEDLPDETFEHGADLRIGARSLYDCFHNLDGENLFEALTTLCQTGMDWRRPISFQ